MKKIILLLFPIMLVACANDANSNNGQKTEEETTTKAIQPEASQEQPQPSAATNTQNNAGITLSISNASAASGETICVDVLAKDFVNILTTQYSIHWDKDIIQFEGLKNFNLPYLSNQNFGTHIVKEGILTAVWIDNTLKGVRVPDGSSIYQICFKAIGKSGSSSTVAFKPTPTPYEVVNLQEKVIGLNGQEGIVEVK